MKIDHLIADTAILQELGHRLSLNRKQRGMSQERFAQTAGIGVATLRRIEDGRDSQLGSWIKILKALKLESSIEQLLPESFNSPMAEVKSTKKRNKQKLPSAGFSWGDEFQ